ncbi:hypothetical protein HNY73_016445 [Argiope bruennichi]|uniref:Uncharacterized protein n=1 Tax=Argiope bruennichi TaxID=94029 RepID=A0A8T0EIT1_ARGBR|nr:hypothetical protein HNY73_016445 [Argiope bruennichi]
MMTRNVVCDTVIEKNNMWMIFEELLDTNESLEEACFILDELQELIRKLPNTMRTNTKQDIAITNSVQILDDSLDKVMETTGVYFDEIEMKLDDIQKYLLRNYSDIHRCMQLVSEVRCDQKYIDTLISNAEKEIYKFLETVDLYMQDRRKCDGRKK